MNITGPVIDLINADTAANALLAGRVYAGKVLQSSSYPAATINVINTIATNTKTQASDLDFVRLQIDVYGTTITSVAQTAEAIRAAIDYQTTGSLGHIEFFNGQDGYSEKPELFRWITEYKIAFKR